MNVVLIGMRGSGKTTVGQILARRLGREFVEMDELITRKANQTIPEMVARHGWARFRDLEEELTTQVARRDNIVHAAGGGVVTREANIAQLKPNGILVWLTASADTLLQRIGEDPGRPPLVQGRTPREDMEITLNEREPLYRQAADLVVDTEGKTPEAVAGLVVKSLARICCLLGDPVAHSLSPLIHNAGYRALGLDYVYLPFRVRDIEGAIAGLRGLGIRGASITLPHKTEALKYLDRLDPTAREIGAVNTVVNDKGVLTGYNTDGDGALQALVKATALEGKKAILIGAGGAAQAIAFGLKKKGVKLVILNRTEDKARSLAEKVNAEGSGNLEKLDEISSADIVINATSVGMWPRTDETIIPKERLHNRLTVFDIVYNPRETRLLTEARERGCAVVYGDKMLLYQAARQFELFTRRPAPITAMASALTQALEGGKDENSDRR